MKGKKYRIFIGLSETSGYYYNLNKGFKELGQDSIFVRLGDDKHSYSNEKTNSQLVEYSKFLNNKWRSLKVKKNPTFLFWKILFITLIPIIFLWAIIKYDVFIFSGRRSFLNHYDYRLLRLLGKKVIRVSLGSFTRPPYVDGTSIGGTYTGRQPSISDLIKMTKKQKNTIKRVDRNVDVMVDHPPQACFHEREFVSLLYLGIPFSTEKFLNSHKNINTMDTDTMRILHAPSYSVHKGTKIIRQIINELKEEGFKIDYIEISNMPNEIVLEEIQKCDFVIDELYSDSPMATLAAEAAYFGKPTIIGGYYATCLRDYYDESIIPPTLFCHPDKIKEAVIKLINEKEYRLKLGKEAQQYVLNKWNPKRVASNYMRLITGDIPKEWLYNPSNIRYLNGYGLNEKHLKETIVKMVKEGGLASLQLHDKPELEKLYYELAFSLDKNIK